MSVVMLSICMGRERNLEGLFLMWHAWMSMIKKGECDIYYVVEIN